MGRSIYSLTTISQCMHFFLITTRNFRLKCRELRLTKIESNSCNLPGVCSALLVFFHAWHPEGSSTSCLYVGHRWPEPHAGFRNHQSGSLGSSSFWYSLSELASQSSLGRLCALSLCLPDFHSLFRAHQHRLA